MKSLGESAGFDSLIEEIKAINGGWKVSQLYLGNTSGLSRSLRQHKTRRQIELLLEVGAPSIYIQLDDTSNAEEPLYGILVRDSSSAYRDADHIPVRVLRDYLNQEQIDALANAKPTQADIQS
jgi:hypothetical protein